MISTSHRRRASAVRNRPAKRVGWRTDYFFLNWVNIFKMIACASGGKCDSPLRKKTMPACDDIYNNKGALNTLKLSITSQSYFLITPLFLRIALS